MGRKVDVPAAAAAAAAAAVSAGGVEAGGVVGWDNVLAALANPFS